MAELYRVPSPKTKMIFHVFSPPSSPTREKSCFVVGDCVSCHAAISEVNRSGEGNSALAFSQKNGKTFPSNGPLMTRSPRVKARPAKVYKSRFDRLISDSRSKWPLSLCSTTRLRRAQVTYDSLLREMGGVLALAYDGCDIFVSSGSSFSLR